MFSSGNFQFLRGRSAVLLNAVLALQIAAIYSISREERGPKVAPLEQIASELGHWRSTQDGFLDEETMRILRPDDYLLRSYAHSGTRQPASLFVAYFRSQQSGHAPHTPKNCLPGQGWLPVSSGIVPLSLGGGQSDIRVNRFIVAKGEERAFVFYWYQTPTGVVASEYMAKVHLVLDSIRHRRSDTALVRIVLPFREADAQAVEQSAADFVRSLYPALHRHIPTV
jgi:EpsI family protein